MLDALGPAIVIVLYSAALLMVLRLPREFVETDEGTSIPWWRSVRFAAALVASVQILVYAIWG